MKVLMTNSSNEHLLAPQYYKELEKQDVEIRGTYYLDLLDTKLHSRRINKVCFKLKPSMFYKNCNNQLLQDVSNYKPDILWIFKGMEIYPETLQHIKASNVKLINYNLDHPFRFISKGSGNENVRRSIPLYDLHISYSKRIINELKEKYPSVKTFHLPFGYHSYVDGLLPSAEERNKVCFMGYGDPLRAEIIKFLASNNLPVDVYGDNWKRYLSIERNVNIYPPVYNEQYWNVLSKYRVQLNIFRDHNIDSHNMRTFEIPAIGGIMLATYSSEQVEYFKENEEAFYFKNNMEMLEKAQHVLSMPHTSADVIRIRARDRSIQSGYSYAERSKNVLKEFNNIIHG